MLSVADRVSLPYTAYGIKTTLDDIPDELLLEIFQVSICFLSLVAFLYFFPSHSYPPFMSLCRGWNQSKSEND